MKLVIVIPAFNEEDTIGQVIQSIPKQFIGISNVLIVVINDGSTDQTKELAESAGALVVSHSRNQGVGRAFHTGLKSALELNADIMINMDADGQFSPTDIPKLINPILEGKAGLVVGDRFSNEDGTLQKPQHMSSVKFWGNKEMSKLISALTGQKFSDVSCGFRAYSKEALLRMNLTGNFTYTQESFLDLASKGIEIRTIPVNIKYFPERKSKVARNLFHYAYQTLKIIIRSYRDYRPLKFFSILGLVVFFFGFIFGMITLIHYLVAGAFTPYKFVGYLSVYLVSLALLFWIIGLFADMFVRTRNIQEQILYYEKLRYYYNE